MSDISVCVVGSTAFVTMYCSHMNGCLTSLVRVLCLVCPDSTKELKYYDWSLQTSFTAQDKYSGLFTPLPHPDPACNMYDAVAALAHVADLMVPIVERSRHYPATESTDGLFRSTAVWRLRSALHARFVWVPACSLFPSIERLSCVFCFLFLLLIVD